MKKILIKILTVIFVLNVVFVYLPIFSKAVNNASAVLTVKEDQYEINESFSVTFTITSAVDLYFTSYEITYDPDSLLFIPGQGQEDANGSIVELIDNKGTELRKITRTFNFTAKKVGNTEISVTKIRNIDAETASNVETDIGNVSLTITEKLKSSNCNIKEIDVSIGEVSPDFDPDVLEYKISKIPAGTKVCYINFSLEDSTARSEISGNEYISVGENKRTITVTAANGTVKKYVFTIIRPEDPTPTPTVKPTATPTSNPSETVVPSEPTPTPVVPVNPVLGDVDIEEDTFTIYDINVYLSSISPTSEFKESTNFLFDSEVVYGISAYETGTKTQYLVYASKNGGSKQLYIFDTQDKSIQRYMGSTSNVLSNFELLENQEVKNTAEIEDISTATPDIETTPSPTAAPQQGTSSKPISASLFFGAGVIIIFIAIFFVVVTLVNINKKK